jgi:hypothetical protein
MRNQSLFDYLAAFVTIVLAIALSDMLMSMHRLLVARDRVRWNVIPLGAALFVFLGLISEFFSIRIFADVATVPFAYLVLLVCVSGLIAMAAFAVLPDEVPSAGLSLWDFYLKRRTQVWILLALGLAGDIARFFADAALSNKFSSAWTPGSVQVYGIEIVEIGIFALLAWRKEQWIHGVGVAFVLLLTMQNVLLWNLR